MRIRPATVRRRAAAFTLLEVLIAVTLLALLSVAVMQVFSTGTATYKFGNRDAVVLQRARFIFDTLDKDLKGIYYLDEDSYNEQAREQIEAYMDLAGRVKDGLASPEELEKLYGEDGEVENPFAVGRLIDLQMFGEDGGDADKLTFATRMSMKLGDPYNMWGLARVHYTVDGDFLIRSRESVEATPREVEGVVITPKEKAFKPEHSIVAPGVKAFDLTYAWWSDNQWFESRSWTSNSRSFRNSANLLAEYDEEDLSRIGGETDEATGGSQDGAEQQYDALPSYVRARIVLVDPENPARTTEMSRIFRIPTALETWTINDRLAEDEQDQEKEVRMAEFTPVYPGALRKQ